MKTETRTRILEIIRLKEEVRPADLIRKLSLSPQAIHRHLRSLLASGIIERRSRGPLTTYRIAGMPRLDAARLWQAAPTEPGENPAEFVCGTRDVFTARLGAFAGLGLSEDDLPLAIALAGEVGNNCFDHNLGKWRDVPGCWFEAQATGGRLWVCIADRGQGVYRSLARVDPGIRDEQAALVAAFERNISGRAPENRGNGLKFVRNIVTAGAGRGLACRSGTGLVEYGALGRECRDELARFASQPGGTVTLALWSLK